MTIIEQLEKILSEECCNECHSPLTDAEREQGYVCFKCVEDWMHHATWDEREE